MLLPDSDHIQKCQNVSPPLPFEAITDLLKKVSSVEMPWKIHFVVVNTIKSEVHFVQI